MPFALVEYEVIITNSRYALVGYFITSYPTRAHGIIVTTHPFSHLLAGGALARPHRLRDEKRAMGLGKAPPAKR